MDNYTNNPQSEKQDKKDEKPLPGEKLGLGTMIAGVLLMMLNAMRYAGFIKGGAASGFGIAASIIIIIYGIVRYLNGDNGPGKKPTPKKRKVIFVAMTVILTAVMGFLCLGGKRDDVMIEDFSVSADGSEMTVHAGVFSSAGYLRKINVSYDDHAVMVDFYSTFGINNSAGAKNEFVIPLKPDSERICFNRGDNYYAAFAKGEDGQWYKFARSLLLYSLQPLSPRDCLSMSSTTMSYISPRVEQYSSTFQGSLVWKCIFTSGPPPTASRQSPLRFLVK